MCGIAWYVLDGLTSTQLEVLIEHAKTISHRGPDCTKIERFKDQLWAFHRLAIINVDPKGMQPFESSTSRTMCNGEIYNYRQFTSSESEPRSDCEVVLQMLDALSSIEDVCESVKTLDGDFAFIWQRENDTVIARDHVGVCPLFYGVGECDELRAIASESKALVGAPGIKMVKVFPPGHVWLNGVFHSYIPSLSQQPLHVTMNEAENKVRELVISSVKKRLDHSDRPVGVLCSGGIDSSIVTCLVAELGLKDRIRVFTMEYEGSRSEDAFFARMLCAKFDLKHTVFSFDRNDVLKTIPVVIKALETYDPNTIRAAVPMYILASKIASQTDVRVILSGEGADELFHGYNYFRLAPSGNDARIESARLISNLHMFDLLRAERCFSHAGVEIRVPFLDQDLVRYVQSIEGEIPWGGKQGFAEKQLLRNAFSYIKELSDLRILDRPKERFSDGCGFSYVPQLLSDISGGLAILNDRLKKEKQFIDDIFDTIYPSHRHLIIERTMPDWARVSTKEELLAM
jgi:asparagine synthase (glutamine-hydrolysing)